MHANNQKEAYQKSDDVVTNWRNFQIQMFQLVELCDCYHQDHIEKTKRENLFRRFQERRKTAANGDGKFASRAEIKQLTKKLLSKDILQLATSY
jgi:hypothetical protein